MTSITVGPAVYDTVTVSGAGVTPTGTVTFWYSTNGGSTWNKLGDPVQLQNGMASSEPMTPAVGNYLFNATYNGDNNYLVSYGKSDAEPLTVIPGVSTPVTTLHLVGSDVKVTSINYGQTVMDTVTVPLHQLAARPPLALLPSGTAPTVIPPGFSSEERYNCRTEWPRLNP